MASTMYDLFEILNKNFPDETPKSQLNIFDQNFLNELQRKGYIEPIMIDSRYSHYKLLPLGFSFLIQMKLHEELGKMTKITEESKIILSSFKNSAKSSSKTATQMTWITIGMAMLTLSVAIVQLIVALL